MTMKIKVLSITASILFVCAGNSFGQQSGPGVSYPDTAPQRGVAPVGAYTFDKLETINKFNGNLTYSIPLTSMPLGRGGMTVPLNLVYNSGLYDFTYYYTYTQQYTHFQTWLNQSLTSDISGGWRLTARYGFYFESKPIAQGDLSCNSGAENRTSLLMPDGSRHLLQFPGFQQGYTSNDGYYPWSYTGGAPGCPSSYHPALTGTVNTFTSDGSFIRVSYNTSTGITVITLPDATTVTISSSGVETIADRNGNTVTDTLYQSTTTSGMYELLSDPWGRTIKIQQPLTGYGYTVTQAGFGGSPLTWTFGPAPNSSSTAFTFPYIVENSQTSGPVSISTQYTNATGSGGGTDQLQVPSDSSTPLTYSFQYGAKSGLLQTVALPSGATTTYSYECNDFTSGCYAYQGDQEHLVNPVKTKAVTWTDKSDNGSVQRTENWSYNISGSSPNVMTITRPDNGVETNYFFTASSCGCNTSLMPVVVRTIEPSGDSVDYYYENNVPYGVPYTFQLPNPYVTAEIHNVVGGGPNPLPSQSSVILYQTDKNGNQVSASTYDWTAYSTANRGTGGVLKAAPTAAGTLLKQVQNAYTVSTVKLAGTGSETITDDTKAYWNSSAPLFLHLLQSSAVSGAGTGAASYYQYDGNGNPTSAAHWDSTKAATQPAPTSLSSSNASVTSWTWDQTSKGNLLTETDPNGNVRNYSYVATGCDSNANLYPSTLTLAYGTSLARTFSYCWDANLGLITSKTDVDNSITTSYSYDPIGRRTQVIEASGPLNKQTNTTYDDANLRLIVKKDLYTPGDGGIVDVTTYDQMYRPTLVQSIQGGSQSPTDPTAGYKVQTRYYYFGNNSYKLVSNPYCGSNIFNLGNCSGTTVSTVTNGEGTMGWTLSTADQDGRVIATESFAGGTLPFPWNTGAAASNDSTCTTAVSTTNAPTTTTGMACTIYNANTAMVTDEAGKKRETITDGLGRLETVVEDPGGSLNYTTNYSYDALDDLIGVSQSGLVRTFAYSSLKRLLAANNPENSGTSVAARLPSSGGSSGQSWTTTYAYDSAGNLTSKEDNLAGHYWLYVRFAESDFGEELYNANGGGRNACSDLLLWGEGPARGLR